MWAFTTPAGVVRLHDLVIGDVEAVAHRHQVLVDQLYRLPTASIGAARELWDLCCRHAGCDPGRPTLDELLNALVPVKSDLPAEYEDGFPISGGRDLTTDQLYVFAAKAYGWPSWSVRRMTRRDLELLIECQPPSFD